jgi:hypothetical protein
VAVAVVDVSLSLLVVPSSLLILILLSLLLVVTVLLASLIFRFLANSLSRDAFSASAVDVVFVVFVETVVSTATVFSSIFLSPPMITRWYFLLNVIPLQFYRLQSLDSQELVLNWKLNE